MADDKKPVTKRLIIGATTPLQLIGPLAQRGAVQTEADQSGDPIIDMEDKVGHTTYEIASLKICWSPLKWSNGSYKLLKSFVTLTVPLKRAGLDSSS